MKALIVGIAVLFSSASYSQSMEDVIYKSDGSILRGSIIEQDFTNQRYRIQLQGGSIFGVAESDILKITKEPTFNHRVEPIAQTYSTIQPTSIQPISHTANSQPTALIDSVLSLGFLAHSVHYPTNDAFNDNERVERFKGARLAMELIHSEHLATRYGLEGGSLDRIEIINEDNDVLDEFAPDYEREFLGIDASLILSTNLQRGWQFHTGLGLFNHIYVTDDQSEQYTGSQLELGLGYSWQSVQLGFQVEAMLASDYPDEVSGQTSASLQLGFNFQ